MSVEHPDEPWFVTRGVVLTPADLSWEAWPDRAAAAGLTTIALHPTVETVTRFVRSDNGRAFLDRCKSAGLKVEYELHAMTELLPRELYACDKQMFRMDEQGERVPQYNLCVSSRPALETATENALAIASVLKPDTRRHFFWGDDGQPWCRCPLCRDLSDSDQALLVTNAVVTALRRVEPQATAGHLAYCNTLAAPNRVTPADGVFLEYAPIHRRYDVPYAQQRGTDALDSLDCLEANLSVFGVDGAQALEYWLDASRFSRWARPTVKIPWDTRVVQADLSAYGSRGIRHATSFGVHIDSDYLARYGEPPLYEYGGALSDWRPRIP